MSTQSTWYHVEHSGLSHNTQFVLSLSSDSQLGIALMSNCSHCQSLDHYWNLLLLHHFDLLFFFLFLFLSLVFHFVYYCLHKRIPPMTTRPVVCKWVMPAILVQDFLYGITYLSSGLSIPDFIHFKSPLD